jgi:cell division protein FtsW (lipid II flippase)
LRDDENSFNAFREGEKMTLTELLILCAVGIPMYLGDFIAYRTSGSSRNVLMQGLTLVTGYLIGLLLYIASDSYPSFKSLAWFGIVLTILLMAVVTGVFGVREEMRKRRYTNKKEF